MRITNRYLASLLLAALILPATTLARRHGVMSWDEMFEKADLIVIAKVQSSKDSGERDPGDSAYIGINSACNVCKVLKGSAKAKAFTLYHYRFERKGLSSDRLSSELEIAPSFLALITAESDPTMAAPEYLMFLKRRTDGRYEPLSGQIDPGDAIRELRYPNK